MDQVTASEMLEEFRLMEGTLFQDEETKLFYLDIKAVVLDSIVSAWEKFSNSESLFHTALDRYYSWSGSVGVEEVDRCITDVRDACDRHFHVAVFYSKQLYGNEDFNKKIVIAKPKIEVLLKTFFRKLVRNVHVKSGSFFSFDPIKQDFILRDCFRQALAESIKIVSAQPASISFNNNEHKNEDLIDEIEKIDKIDIEQQQHDKNTEVVDQIENVVIIEPTVQPVDEKIEEKVEFDVNKVAEDFNVGDSISVFMDNEKKSLLKMPTRVRTVFLS